MHNILNCHFHSNAMSQKLSYFIDILFKVLLTCHYQTKQGFKPRFN